MPKRIIKIIAILLSCIFFVQQAGFAQGLIQLNLGAHLASWQSAVVKDKFRPLHLRYLSYDAQSDNFRLLLDKGDQFKDLRAPAELNQHARVLLNYFLVGLSLPNESFWVNLRPDSPDNIIDPYLAKTEVGRILLESDLQLKKDTASFTSPQTPEGKIYWTKLYQKAEELFGNQEVTIPTLTRPWIVPDEIIIGEAKDAAYIYKATLKVMLEDDYLRDGSQPEAKVSPKEGHFKIGLRTVPDYSFKDPRLKALNEYSSQLIRETIIPKLIKEVNTSKKYAALRQVYYSLILAQWFKARKGLTPQGTVPIRINSYDLTNLTAKTPYDVATYFNAYKENFQKGEYNIKETVSTPYGQVIRSYSSGGELLALKMPAVGTAITDSTTGIKISSLGLGNPGGDKLAEVNIKIQEPGKGPGAGSVLEIPNNDLEQAQDLLDLGKLPEAAVLLEAVIQSYAKIINDNQGAPQGTLGQEIVNAAVDNQKIAQELLKKAQLKLSDDEVRNIELRIDKTRQQILQQQDVIDKVIAQIGRLKLPPVEGETRPLERLMKLFQGVATTTREAANRDFDTVFYPFSGVDILAPLSFFDLQKGSGKPEYTLITLDRYNIFATTDKDLDIIFEARGFLMEHLMSSHSIATESPWILHYLIELLCLGKYMGLNPQEMEAFLNSFKIINCFKTQEGYITEVEFSINSHTIRHIHFQYILKEKFNLDNTSDMFTKNKLAESIEHSKEILFLSKAHQIHPGFHSFATALYPLLPAGTVLLSDSPDTEKVGLERSGLFNKLGELKADFSRLDSINPSAFASLDYGYRHPSELSLWVLGGSQIDYREPSAGQGASLVLNKTKDIVEDVKLSLTKLSKDREVTRETYVELAKLKGAIDTYDSLINDPQLGDDIKVKAKTNLKTAQALFREYTPRIGASGGRFDNQVTFNLGDYQYLQIIISEISANASDAIADLDNPDVLLKMPQEILEQIPLVGQRRSDTTLKVENGELVIMVLDKGAGIYASSTLEKRKGTESLGWDGRGLNNIDEFLKELGGRRELLRVGENRREFSQGTLCTIRIPLQNLKPAAENQTQLPVSADPVSIPQTQNTTGGIDFRFLPIVTQALDNLKLTMKTIPLASLERVDIDNELVELEQLVNAGNIPSTERLKTYLAASCLKGELKQDTDKLVSCISAILRQEEENCAQTDPIVRDILVVITTGRSSQELEKALHSAV
ncbi:ATP-binding protein [bacterium]|nr:MAG: ATP-binding protein [bacterium]